MISVKVEYGNKDRKASKVTDDLIEDSYAARHRAIQELYSHVKMIHARTLAVPHDPSLEIGTKRNFDYSDLGIFGRHLVLSTTIEITPESVSNTVEIEQWSDIPVRDL